MLERKNNGRLGPAQAEAALRRAAELNASSGVRGGRSRSISPEALAEAADRAGIPKERVHQAISERASGLSMEPRNLSHRIYGYSRIKIERQLGIPARLARERLENLLRVEQGLKLRRSTESGSLWDPGDALGVVRRALDFSGDRPLLKARCIELLVDERSGGCGVELTADLYEQRGEYLSLAGIIGATLSLPAAIAGVYEPLYLLALPAALVVPGLGFKLAYGSAREEAMSVMEDLIEASEGPVESPVSQRERHRGRHPGATPDDAAILPTVGRTPEPRRAGPRLRRYRKAEAPPLTTSWPRLFILIGWRVCRTRC